MSGDVILEAIDVVKHFGDGGNWLSPKPPVQAVDGVSLKIRRGETFAIVGESGCGKSTLARLLMEVHAPELSGDERRAKISDLLRKVGLRPEHAGRYPHEFSGGQRQRIGIARALAAGPKLIIGDEPVSALDVSVQAQVINLLGDLRRDLGLTLVIIAHDLNVIRHMSDRVGVMYLGRIVELGTAAEVFASPRHPYTQALLSAIPSMDGASRNKAPTVLGEMPSPSDPPSGCRFHTRCPHAQPLCTVESPELKGQGHEVACHFWEEIAPPQTDPAPAHRSDQAEARFALYRAATTGGTVIHHDKTTTERT